MPPKRILWTNRSVLKFAGDADPVLLIEAKARELVLKALDAGWSGPPYNPLAIADPLRIPVEANSDVVDASTVAVGSGGAGKSALTERLVERYGAHIIKTRDLIRTQLPHVKEDRASLQRGGEKLDRADGGSWVKNALVRLIEDKVGGPVATGFFVIDSVRIPGQVRAVREAFGAAVHHIHLDASDTVLADRYAKRSTKTKEFECYWDVRRSKTEREVRKLAKLADTVVATDRCTPEAVLVRAIALLGLYPRSSTPLVDVLVGGQHGSEGKGNIVGHIAPEYSLLV